MFKKTVLLDRWGFDVFVDKYEKLRCAGFGLTWATLIKYHEVAVQVGRTDFRFYVATPWGPGRDK